MLRTTEFIKSGSPVELSYGPQVSLNPPSFLHLSLEQRWMPYALNFSCFWFLGWWDATFRETGVTSRELLLQLSMFKLLRAKSVRPCYEFILLSTKQLPWCHIRINLLQVQREFCECFPWRIICLQTIIACTVIFAYYGFF
jgi:hypothetical protein